jgi:diguanylate cyclase (GGDEF)-like protein
LIEVKKIYLDKNLEIVDGNRGYYIYFERIGHRFSRIEEIVHPDEREYFLSLLKSNSEKNNEVLRFKKNTDEYRYNTVKVSNCIYNNVEVKCLELIDIYDEFELIEESCIENDKLKSALGILDDSFFFYEKQTNIFRMVHYHGEKCIVDFNIDIDSWKKQMIDDSYVEKNSIAGFIKMIESLKECHSKIYVNLKGSFRTQGKISENLDFIGTRFERDEKISIVGRIVENSSRANSQDTNNLLEELKIDALTKCYNKKTITDYAVKKFSASANSDKTALIIVDLDHFKPVNDAYGHLAGDKVLEQTGTLLRNIVGNQGVVGRYGGDEFLIIINSVNDEITLRGILQSILINSKSKFENLFGEIKVTTSVGAAVFPDNGNTFDELFKKADFCLYRAKDKGRNRYVFYRPELHPALYLKSVEATSGVKYQGRDVLELQFMTEFMRDLSSSPFKAIRNILNHMCETYNLNDITIYYGESLHRIYTAGKKRDEMESADYIHLPGFRKALGSERFIRMDFPEDIKPDALDFLNAIVSRGIKSTIQCILGTADDIKGLVTFNRTKESSQWAEYEVNCALMFASTFNLLPESVKVDFALYSKLKD